MLRQQQLGVIAALLDAEDAPDKVKLSILKFATTVGPSWVQRQRLPQ